MDELQELVIEACRHPPGSPQRQRALTKVIRLASRKLWRENVAYYEDALQQTWVYFCQNVCEATTGRKYDPTQSSVVTWLSAYLKRRLQDFYIQGREQEARRAPVRNMASRSGEAGEPIDPIDNLAANPDVPPILQEVRDWVEADGSGDLVKTHIKGHPEVNCRALLLRRLPPETSWEDISAEFGLPISTLSSFYQRQCLPRLRKFGESEGYL